MIFVYEDHAKSKDLAFAWDLYAVARSSLNKTSEWKLLRVQWEIIEILRLRKFIRFANEFTSLRMTRIKKFVS